MKRTKKEPNNKLWYHNKNYGNTNLSTVILKGYLRKTGNCRKTEQIEVGCLNTDYSVVYRRDNLDKLTENRSRRNVDNQEHDKITQTMPSNDLF